VDAGSGKERRSLTKDGIVGAGRGNVIVERTSGKTCQMLSLDAITWQVKWQHLEKCFTDDRYTISADGTIYAWEWRDGICSLNGETGTVRWATKVGRKIGAAPVIGPDNILYVGAGPNLVAALDARTGDTKWSVSLGNDLASLLMDEDYTHVVL